MTAPTRDERHYRRYCVKCERQTAHRGPVCAWCGRCNKRLTFRVEKRPLLVHTPLVLEVDGLELRLVETYHCNGTGAQRLMYGKRVLHARLIPQVQKG